MKPVRILSVVSLTTALMACGGGGDSADESSASGSKSTAISNRSLVVLTANNAQTAASATATASEKVNNAQNGGTKLVAASLVGSSEASHFNLIDFTRQQTEKLMSQAGVNISASFRTVSSYPAEPCTGGGTYSISYDDKNTASINDDVVTFKFNNCIEGGETANGTMEIAFSSIAGDVVSGSSWSILAKVSFINFSWSAPGDSGSMQGSVVVAMSTTDSVHYHYEISGTGNDILTFTDSTDTMELSNYMVKANDNVSTGAFNFDFSGHIVSAKLGGAFDALTTTLFEGVGDNDPEKGVMVLNGANGSKIIMTALNSLYVKLETDTDGDVVIDDAKTVTWSSL